MLNLVLQEYRRQRAALQHQVKSVSQELTCLDGAAYDRKNSEFQILATRLQDKEQQIAQAEQDLILTRQNRLESILSESADLPLSTIARAYQLALNQRSIGQTLNDLHSYIHDLSNRSSPPEHHHTPLERFVGYLRTQELELDENTRNCLTQWSRESIDNLYALDQQIIAEQAQQDAKESCLLIRVMANGEQYRIRSWYISDIITYRQEPPSSSNPLSTAGYTDALTPDPITAESAQDYPFETAQLEPVIRYLHRQCLNQYTNPDSIHLFLPAALLNKDIDQWPIKLQRPPLFGTKHKILLRSNDRLGAHFDYREDWEKKWAALDGHTQSNAHQTLVRANSNDIDHLYSLADRSTTLALALEAPLCSAADIEELFETLVLDTPLPLALWMRQKISGIICPQELTRILQTCCIEQLPSTLKDERVSAKQHPTCHIGTALSLLHDDPYLLPPSTY